MKISDKKIDDITFITIVNDKNLEIVLSTFGASIYKIVEKGRIVTLTPLSLNDFYNSNAYFGKTVGRFSGRIDNATLNINGKTYTLDKNWNNINSLHGGNKGISFVNFAYEINKSTNYVDVVFTYLDIEDKLPGDVTFKITYRIDKQTDTFTIFYNAVSNKDTLLNLTNHCYFNLGNKNTILEHNLLLTCDHYGNLNENLICKSIDKVNIEMDFTCKHKIGKYIEDVASKNKTANGYDHFYIKSDESKPHILTMSSSDDKLTLEIETSYPSIVIYTYNYPKDIEYLNDFKVGKYAAIALECQLVPNGINMETVDKGISKANTNYFHFIKYSFK